MNIERVTLNIPREYLAAVGRLGGQVTGKCKRRGGRKFYQELVAKRKDRQK